MIASHNSMSYLTPTKLWMKFINPWAKCQNEDIQTQINKGVRYFDFRIRPFENGIKYEPHFCHNIIDYGKANLFNSFGLIDKAASTLQGIKFYVRVTLDVRTKPNNAEEMVEWFKNYVNQLKSLYPHIIFDSIKIFWDWENDLAEQNVTVTEKHWSVVDKKWCEYLMPIKWFANVHNQEYKKEFDEKHLTDDQDTITLMIDYI